MIVDHIVIAPTRTIAIGVARSLGMTKATEPRWILISGPSDVQRLQGLTLDEDVPVSTVGPERSWMRDARLTVAARKRVTA